MTKRLSLLKYLVLMTGALIPTSEVFAAKIYQCRAYAGGEFFSNTACSQQQALMLGVFEVPDRMPFDQQVNLVQQRLGQTGAAKAAEDNDLTRRQECFVIERQLTELTRKYERGQYVSVPEVNVDQARELQLKKRRSALNCY